MVSLAGGGACLLDATGEDGGDDVFAARTAGFNFGGGAVFGFKLEGRGCRAFGLGPSIVDFAVGRDLFGLALLVARTADLILQFFNFALEAEVLSMPLNLRNTHFFLFRAAECLKLGSECSF